MLRKKIFITVLVFLLFIPLISFDTYALSASSAAVMLADTKELLFEKDAHKKMSMASTTKIMTALLACESGRLYEEVNITDDMIRVEGTSMGLKKGDSLTLYNIVMGMMLLSGNDAANAVAIYLSGSIKSFASLMNEKARELGMNDTHFVTASGLDDDEHYSTAYDMALLASYAMKNPVFREFVCVYSGKVEYISPDLVCTYRNHNKFLKMYDGACGIKTGFTKKSGRCLVTAVDKDGCLVVAVTLKAPDDWNDHVFLYNNCLDKIKKSSISDRYNCVLSVVGGEKNTVSASLKEDISLFSKSGKVKTELLTEKINYAPIKNGDCLGKVRVFINGEKYGDYFITADESIDKIIVISFKDRLINKLNELFRRFEKWLTAA